jgi:glycosyltransferase involved in cell wall biosynthesis
MKIAIDLQGAQSPGSRNRGIGRYSVSIAQAIARNRGENEVLIVLSNAYPETLCDIIESFEGLLPKSSFHFFEVPRANGLYAKDSWRRQAAELLREAFIESLNPDVILITSLFEGCGDDVITSIGKFSQIPTAVVVYDLIPFIYKEVYLANPIVERWYLDKLVYLKKAHLLLTISESTKQELIRSLDISSRDAVSIGTDAETMFCSEELSFSKASGIALRFNLSRSYIMYTGGVDARKNPECLIRAFAMLDNKLRQMYQLAIVCKLPPAEEARLRSLARILGLKESEVVFTGYVEDSVIVDLYRMCSLFVFPSWHEGFGLPILEAIRCGAPVIGSNTSSIPEVIGANEALFDPHDPHSAALLINKVLTDDAFKGALLKQQKEHSKRFSWDESGIRAIRALNRLQSPVSRLDDLALLPTLIQAISKLRVHPSTGDIIAISNAIDQSLPKRIAL